MSIWLKIAVILSVIGIIGFTVIMSINGWDFEKLNTVKYENNSYVINDNFSNILINSDTADIIIEKSINNESKVVCYEMKKVKHSVSVENDTLTIKVIDTRKWYEHIAINFSKPKITVYLPENEYSSITINEKTGNIEIPNDFKFNSVDISCSTGDVCCNANATDSVKVVASTGDVSVKNTAVGLLDVKVSTGNVSVYNVECDSSINIKVSTGNANLVDVNCSELQISGSTGDTYLKSVKALEKISINVKTGDVKFDQSDAYEIYVKTSTGNVKGSILSNKVFTAKSGTGKVNVPNSTQGGKCDITTGTGNIILYVVKE